MNRSNPIIFRRAPGLVALVAAAALLASSAGQMATAQTAVAVDPVPSRRSTVSGIDFVATGNGRFGFDSTTPHGGFIAPRSSGRAYLYGSGLWFGTMRRFPEGDRPLVFSTYNPSTGWSNAVPGDTGGSGLPLVYQSADYDLLGNPLVAVERWPLWLAEMVDTVKMMYPGIYVPDTARRTIGEFDGGPAFASLAQEQMVTRYHDRDLGSYEDGPEVAAQQGYPIGLQIQQNIFSWNRDPLRNAVIVQYQIVNVSRDTLHGCVIGHVADPDIGAGENDHVTRTTLDSHRRTILGWSDSDQGDAAYGTLATMLVEAPVVGAGGYISSAERMRFRKTGSIGVFSRWIGDAGIATTKDRYDAMTLPAWSGDADSGAADQRMVIASDTFSFRPGDTAYFAIGYGVFEGKLGKSSGSATLRHQETGGAPGFTPGELESFSRRLYDVYYSTSEPVAAAVGSGDQPGKIGASLAPNPAGDHATLRFSLDEEERVILRIVDRLGREVLRSDLGLLAAGGHLHAIDLSGLEAGAYLASIESGAARRVLPLTVLR